MGYRDRSLFSSKSIRSAFVSKVYSILCVQILIATAIIGWFIYHEPTKQYMLKNGHYFVYGAFAVGILTYLILICVESARRSYPMNFVLLFLLTIAYGVMAAVMSTRYQTNTVFCAFLATAFATFTVILLAKFSPFDMTTCGCGLCILGIIHLIASIILIIVLVPQHAQLSSTIIAGSGAFLVSLYMMFDLQLIMGGRTMELSPEEYILGAVLLYIDIISLLQYMLILFGRRE